MADQKRGEDAADHAPAPRKQPDPKTKDGGNEQDAENYRNKADDRRAIKDEDLSSANDE